MASGRIMNHQLVQLAGSYVSTWTSVVEGIIFMIGSHKPGYVHPWWNTFWMDRRDKYHWSGRSGQLGELFWTIHVGDVHSGRFSLASNCIKLQYTVYTSMHTIGLLYQPHTSSYIIWLRSWSTKSNKQRFSEVPWICVFFWGKPRIHPSWVTQKYVQLCQHQEELTRRLDEAVDKIGIKMCWEATGGGRSEWHLEKLKELPLWFKYIMVDAKIEPRGWKVLATNKSGDEFSDNLISQLILPSMTWQVIPWCMKSSCYDDMVSFDSTEFEEGDFAINDNLGNCQGLLECCKKGGDFG